MTITLKIFIPFWRRFGFFFSGTVFANAWVEPSWYVQGVLHPGQAWIDYSSGNIILPTPVAYAGTGRDRTGSTIATQEKEDRDG